MENFSYHLIFWHALEDKMFSNMNLKIISIQLYDIFNILNIEKKCYKLPWSQENIIFEIKKPDNINLCLKNDSEMIGYIFTNKIDGEIYIINFCIQPEYQNQKLGSFFFKEVLDFIKKDDCRKIFLEVRESNLPAIKLYKSNGFVEDCIRKHFYDDDESAILMHLDC